MKKISDSLYATIFPTELDPAQKRRIEIAEGAIRGYVTVGVERTTLEVIAKLSGVSRPLIMHYFKDRESIFELAVRLIRANLQNLAVEAMREQTTALGTLDAYVKNVFMWGEQWGDHAKVWILYYYTASIHETHRRNHSELADMGHRRIEAILREGVREKAFICKDPRTAAKAIQMAITGGFVTMLSEKGILPREKLLKATLKTCRLLAGVKKP